MQEHFLKQKFNLKSYRILKKFLFMQEPEKVHDAFTAMGEYLGRGKVSKKILWKFYNYSHPSLEQKIEGIKFRNPIGLSAGFDYDAHLTQILPSIGFGFHTVGSVTFGAYEGNAAPRLARLVKSKSLLVNKGLKSKGGRAIIDYLKDKKFEIPLGISIAKTNCKETAEQGKGIEDYIKSFKLWEKAGVGDYYELNISCPNAFGGEPFTTPQSLNALLEEIDKLKLKKPLFMKMPVDFSTKETDALCKAAAKHSVQGLIFGNLTKDRKNPLFDKEEIKKAGKGNFSGMPMFEKSNSLIAFAYKKYKERFVIIGCGGVFNACDAYKKIKLGASLVQLITGMIYRGPGVIGEINQGLVELLKKDGFSSISQAVGADNK